MFKTLNRIGFLRTVLDDAGFRQILCTSSAHMTRLREGTENAEAVALSTKAIQSLNRKITDPVMGISDGVIVTILAFACHAVSHPYLRTSTCTTQVSENADRITTNRSCSMIFRAR